MTIFVILLPDPNPEIAARIAAEFSGDFLRLTDQQFLVSGSGTTVDISRRIGVHDAANPSAPSLGSAIVFATTSYFGRAQISVWEWIRSKVESASAA